MSDPDGIDPEYNDPGNHDGEHPPDWDARREYVYRLDGHACQQCGREEDADLRVLHVVPLSEGGSHHPENLVTVCEPCYHHLQEHPVAGSNAPGQSVVPGAVVAGYVLYPVALLWGIGHLGPAVTALPVLAAGGSVLLAVLAAGRYPLSATIGALIWGCLLVPGGYAGVFVGAGGSGAALVAGVLALPVVVASLLRRAAGVDRE